jgi:hypothetical protein
LNVQIGQAWSAATRMKAIWKSTLPTELLRELFSAKVLSILLNAFETWSCINEINQKT